MPIYEYVCKDCERGFEVIVRGSERPACPSCGGRRLDKQLSVFATIRGDTAGGDLPAGTGPCGACGDPRGPGSCASD
jgi:putative FmdB family regulatory protein